MYYSSVLGLTSANANSWKKAKKTLLFTVLSVAVLWVKTILTQKKEWGTIGINQLYERMPDFMQDVCFYSWLMKCNTCTMFYSDKLLRKQLLLEQYFHLLFFFSFFSSSPSASSSDNGSGSGEGGEYPTPITRAFGLLVYIYLCLVYVRDCYSTGIKEKLW